MTQYLDTNPMQVGGGYKPSLMDQLQGLISGLDQTKLAVMGDVSHWTGKLNKELIAGADLWSPKGTDGHQVQAGSSGDLGNYKDDQLDNTIQLCYDVGRPCLPFHYVEWDYTQDQWKIDKIVNFQYDIICESLRGKTPHKSYHGYVLDCEEKHGCTDTNFRDIVRGIYDKLMVSSVLDGMPLIIYTSQDIFNTYPAFRDWAIAPSTNRLLWLAQWTYTKAWSGTWEQWRQQVLPQTNMRVITPKDWWAVQWSASCKINGFNIDVSSTTRTKEALYDWLKYTPNTAPVEPPPPPVVVPGDGVSQKAFDELKADHELLKAWAKDIGYKA